MIAIGKCLLLTRRFEDAAKYYAEANEMLSVSAPQSDAAATGMCTCVMFECVSMVNTCLGKLNGSFVN